MVLRNTIKRRRRVIISKRRKIKIKSRKTRGSRKIIMKGGVKVNDQEVKSFQGTYNDDGSINDGKGTMTYENGDVYNGLWMNSVKNGLGVMTYANGDVYVGNWKDDKKNGKGTLRYNETERVDNGIWKNDELIEGNRIEISHVRSLSGTNSLYKYTGTFKNNEPDGFGTIETTEYEYKGEHDRGLPHGQGKLDRKVSGIYFTYEGTFVNGALHGQARQVSRDGNIKYDGTWKNGQKENGTLTIIKKKEYGITYFTETKYVNGKRQKEGEVQSYSDINPAAG